jgi:GMP synthase (glutamine-hydrolysing)
MLVQALGRERLKPLRGLCRDRASTSFRLPKKAAACCLGRRPCLQWHREGFNLPGGSQAAGAREIFENQAFSVDNTAFGLQFHSELTYAMACRWTVRGADRFNLPMAQPRAKHMEGWFRYDPPVRAWLWDFLDFWLARDRRGIAAQRAA